MTPGNDAAFLKKLLATFKVEAEEHVAAISSGLVELEHAASRERRMEIVETIFREAHSLKGAARAVNLSKLESICQSLESFFAEMKRRDAVLPPDQYDRLHKMVGSAASEIVAATGAPKPAPKADVPAPKPEAPAEAPEPRPAAEEKTGLPDTVRVSSAKLAAVLRQAEELISVKATGAHRLTELNAISASVRLLEREWRKLRSHVRGSADAENGHAVRTNGAENHSSASRNLLELADRNERVLQSISSQVTLLRTAMENDHRILDRRVGELLDETKRLSMQPFSFLLAGFPKLVRDLSRDCGKDAELVVHGGDIEASRRILDEIKDPLIHLVRNSIDHGIGSRAERESKGKPARGTITIAISPKTRGRVELSVSDDGAGIDPRKVVATAVRNGLLSPEDAQRTDDRQALSLIFQSGFSTSPMLTKVSGRGLGLAIVREKVEGLGGDVSVETHTGLGTTFRLALPLTVATFRGILVRTGECWFVIPTMYVQKALRVDHRDIRTVENRPAIELDRQNVSVVWLVETLGIGTRAPAAEANSRFPGVLLESGGDRIVFLVDEVLRDQEVLVKNLGKPLVRVRNIAGAVALETGAVAPVLNVADLMRSAAKSSWAGPVLQAEQKPKSILLVEDSITARTLLKGILESAGYVVTTAVDGVDALALLEKNAVDLVVSDVEMPQMGGFDLTASIRANRELEDLPVVLVTSLDTGEDRQRGAEAGANAYIVKSSFEQSNLLEIIQRLI